VDDRPDDVERGDPRIVEDLVEPVDRRGRDVVRLEPVEPRPPRLGREDRLEDRHELVVVRDPGGAIEEPRVLAQVGPADRVGEPLPELGRRREMDDERASVAGDEA